jgi:hypothetical protein
MSSVTIWKLTSFKHDTMVLVLSLLLLGVLFVTPLCFTFSVNSLYLEIHVVTHPSDVLYNEYLRSLQFFPSLAAAFSYVSITEVMFVHMFCDDIEGLRIWCRLLWVLPPLIMSARQHPPFPISWSFYFRIAGGWGWGGWMDPKHTTAKKLGVLPIIYVLFCTISEANIQNFTTYLLQLPPTCSTVLYSIYGVFFTAYSNALRGSEMCLYGLAPSKLILHLN